MAKAKKKTASKKKATAKQKAAGKNKPEAKKKAAGKKKPEAKKKAAGKNKPEAKKKATGKNKPEAKKKPASKNKPEAKKKPQAKSKVSKKKGKGGKKAKVTLADAADRHVLYQLSVQSPEADIEFFAERYEELRGREPKVLREDFCGTAYISSTWAASGPDRRAVGVDLDGATLQWGREHNLAPLSEDARSRIDLRQTNVLDGGGEPADMTCAMNFSYGVFKTRAELRRYLQVVYDNLADEGVFITELYGGVEAIIEVVDERDIEDPDGNVEDFTYIWEQAAYNPITHETLCHIHFRMSDGSKIKKAFTYDWRLWSIPELRELLYEVGFTSARVYWEGTDDDGEGTGEYYPTEKEDNQESWLVYIVAGK
ncbi:MAG: class I SAM-dependent methyltransferase [Nannocystaceae bacterium]